jgi:hypothetical protein
MSPYWVTGFERRFIELIVLCFKFSFVWSHVSQKPFRLVKRTFVCFVLFTRLCEFEVNHFSWLPWFSFCIGVLFLGYLSKWHYSAFKIMWFYIVSENPNLFLMCLYIASANPKIYYPLVPAPVMICCERRIRAINHVVFINLISYTSTISNNLSFFLVIATKGY